MKDKLFVVYNKLSCRYGSVFSSASDATALRAFEQSFKDYLNDFELCSVGTIDIATGVVDSGPVVRIPLVLSTSTGVPINDIEKRMEMNNG